MMYFFVALASVLALIGFVLTLLHTKASKMLTVEIKLENGTVERYVLTNAKIGENFISGNTVSKDGKWSTDIMFPISKIECVIINQIPYVKKKKTFFNKSDK